MRDHEASFVADLDASVGRLLLDHFAENRNPWWAERLSSAQFEGAALKEAYLGNGCLVQVQTALWAIVAQRRRSSESDAEQIVGKSLHSAGS